MTSSSTPTPGGAAAALLALPAALDVPDFVDRFLFQGFAVDLCADLQLSATQFTLLTGFVFTTFPTLFGLAMGVLADRLRDGGSDAPYTPAGAIGLLPWAFAIPCLPAAARRARPAAAGGAEVAA